MTLLLKTPHILITEHEEIKSVIIRKLPSYWLDLKYQKVPCRFLWGKSLTPLWSTWATITSLERHAHECHSVTDAIGISNHFLFNLRLAPQEKMLAWYHRSGQELVVGKVKVSRDKAITIILLNWHSFKLVFICVSVCPWLVPLLFHFRKVSFFFNGSGWNRNGQLTEV